MMNGHSDLQQTSISSDFKIPAIEAPRYYQTRLDLEYILKAA